MTTTCGSCRFYQPLPEEDAIRLRLQGYTVPEGMGLCGWVPMALLSFPKAFTITIQPMHKDDEKECERFSPRLLELVEPEGEPGIPAKVLPFSRKSDVEDLIS